MDNITKLFLDIADKHPGNIAIIERNKKVSYRELRAKMLDTAAYFKTKGIGKGDRVLVFVPMGVDLYRVVLALFYLGATAVFLDEWVGAKRLKECTDLADCKALVGGGKLQFYALVNRSLRKISIKLKANSPSSQYPHPKMVAVDEDTPALITFTTGSVGKPKAALRTHLFLNEQFKVLKDEIKLKSTDVVLITLPIVVLLNLASGGTTVMADFNAAKIKNLNPKKIFKQVNQLNANGLIASPHFVTELAQYQVKNGLSLPRLSFLITGGAPVFPNMAALYREAFGPADVEIIYGSTEAEPISSIPGSELIRESKVNGNKGVLVGKINPAARVKIIHIKNDELAVKNEESLSKLEVNPGEIGEIIVSGSHVLKQYFRSPEGFKRNKIVTDCNTWHRTDDSGYIDGNGNLYLTGRCRQLIKWGGKYVSPFIYEHVLSTIEGVVIGTVISENQKLKVVVELKKEAGIEEIYSALSDSSLPYDSIQVVQKIPRDPRHNSKIDYDAMRLKS
ncbi:MAG: AMP-binding protein [Bacteroidales bacterium]|nr:AMP-binding protein [Bacteroidales bacterium]